MTGKLNFRQASVFVNPTLAWEMSAEYERHVYFDKRDEKGKANAALFDWLERVRLEKLNGTPDTKEEPCPTEMIPLKK